MDATTRKKVEANLFPSAHQAVEPWDKFPWHYSGSGATKACDTWVQHSSQALAIDVFGTIRTLQQEDRNSCMNEVARMVGLPEASDWRVDLEWCDPDNRLNEPKNVQHTQVDVVARSETSWLFFECKFCEQDGGACSQPKPIPRGGNRDKRQCNGRYELQVNPVMPDRGQHHCALTGKGIRYWELVPSVFTIDSTASHNPCPFSGPWYQWMRNLTLARAVAVSTGAKTAFFVIYADHPALPFPKKLQTPEWRTFVEDRVRQDAVPLRTLSYQGLIDMAARVNGSRASSAAVWADLRDWVNRKIEMVSKTI